MDILISLIGLIFTNKLILTFLQNLAGFVWCVILEKPSRVCLVCIHFLSKMKNEFLQNPY